MRRHPSGPRSFLATALASATAILVGATITLAGPATENVKATAEVRLTTSRMIGLAPMNLEVSAVLRNAADRQTQLAADERAVLEVRSSYMEMATGDRGVSVPCEAPKWAGPQMTQNLVLHRPGTYTLQWKIEDADGNWVRSNPVQVRVQ